MLAPSKGKGGSSWDAHKGSSGWDANISHGPSWEGPAWQGKGQGMWEPPSWALPCDTLSAAGLGLFGCASRSTGPTSILTSLVQEASSFGVCLNKICVRPFVFRARELPKLQLERPIQVH